MSDSDQDIRIRRMAKDSDRRHDGEAEDVVQNNGGRFNEGEDAG